jgi:hypothetical protein
MRRTTMNDIAREAGISRPRSTSTYRTATGYGATGRLATARVAM